MLVRFRAMVLVSIACVAVVGCGARERSYRLVGVVRQVDPARGDVAIRHEAIPGYMPAMTMPFEVKDRGLLAKLRPGDAVEGTLRVRGEESELTGLRVTKPAEEGGPDRS